MQTDHALGWPQEALQLKWFFDIVPVWPQGDTVVCWSWLLLAPERRACMHPSSNMHSLTKLWFETGHDRSIYLANQSKTLFYSQRFPPIRKLPEASYPHPSEGWQNENHNHRKLTNLITWTTALSSSLKLWAMPCRATQDGQVMLESSDKTRPTGEGNGKPLQYSCLDNPMNSM